MLLAIIVVFISGAALVRHGLAFSNRKSDFEFWVEFITLLAGFIVTLSFVFLFE